MALADITSETRIILKILAASLTVVIILFLFFKGAQYIKKLFFTPKIPPQMAFGKLPIINFPKQPPTDVKYEINTIDGKLPLFTDRINVYKVKINGVSITALQDSRAIVKQAGFTASETKINDALYQWTDGAGSSIQYNILTNNFKIQPDYSLAPGFSVTDLDERLTNPQGATQIAQTFLGRLSEDTTDLDPAKTKITYLKMDEKNSLVQAVSQSDAQFIRIDLFQKDINKFPVYYPSWSGSVIYMVFKNDSGAQKIADAAYLHFQPDLMSSSDYYIKTSQAAYDDLKAGKGVVFRSTQDSTLQVTDVGLGYYIGNEQNRDFILPIYIFSGNNFKAYVQALPDELVEE